MSFQAIKKGSVGCDLTPSYSILKEGIFCDCGGDSVCKLSHKHDDLFNPHNLHTHTRK